MFILRKDPICFGCKKFLNENPDDILKDNEVRELKTCSKCKTVQYCSRDCLQKNWTEKDGHKQVCNDISKLMKSIDKIETLNEGIGDLKMITDKDVEDFFTEKSQFAIKKYHGISGVYRYLDNYESSPRKEYIEKKLTLAYIIWYLAEKHDSYVFYEKYFNAITHLMRYSPCISEDVIYSVVICLLHLDRDQDAYNLIRLHCVDIS